MNNGTLSPLEIGETSQKHPIDFPGRNGPREPLRVAIVTYSMLAFGGAEKQAYYIARALAQANVEVRCYSVHGLSLGNAQNVGGTYEDDLRRIHVQWRRFGWTPGLPCRLLILLAQLQRFRPHLIQSVHASTNLYAAIAGRVLRTTSIGGIRCDLEALLEDARCFARYLLSWPDAIVANSMKALDELKKSGIVKPDRLHFLPNVIDLTSFPERAGMRRQVVVGTEYTCICVARLQPPKRVDMFLRALAAARAVEPRFRGVVVGSGPQEADLRRLAAELRLLPDGVSFLGYRKNVAALLQQADMFVFCSESEGMPNVILEAMAAGLPVIATPAGDVTELVESAGAGYLTPFGDVAAIARAMLRLARSAALREELGRAGRNYIARHRTLSHLAGRLVQIYGDVARTVPRGRNKLALKN